MDTECDSKTLHGSITIKFCILSRQNTTVTCYEVWRLVTALRCVCTVRWHAVLLTLQLFKANNTNLSTFSSLLQII